MKNRACAVAGMFYPRDPSHLEQVLEKYFHGTGEPTGAIGVVSPHAGYVYSGAVAATAIGCIPADYRGTIVVIGPSHRGFQTCVSMIPWETPLGIVDVDVEYVKALDIVVDEVSHQDEHSLEVQMPFLKFRFQGARIAPVMMGDQSYESAEWLADRIIAAAEDLGRGIRIIASSDFSHYVPESQARKQDLLAIEALERYDVQEFYRRIGELGVSACGYGPIAAMALASRSMGATKVRLVRYATSGDVTGERDQVVGYAAIAVM